MTDTTTATTAVTLMERPLIARAKTFGLHLLDVWAHSPRLAGAAWRWVRNPEAWADLKAEKLRPVAYQREAEALTKGMYGRIILLALVAVPVAIIGGTILASSGALWWPLLLLMAYGAGQAALHLPKATQGTGDATEEYTGERAGIRKMLFAKLTKVDRLESITVSELEEVYDGEAGSIGRRCIIGLPSTNTSADVEKLRANLAGVLGTRTVRVDITEGTSPRQAIMFVADRSPDEIPPPAWPLADATRTHQFIADPFPLGIDTATQKPVLVDLSDDAGVLITGLPGSGKTWTLRAFLAASGADPKSTTILADFKGKATDYKKPLAGSLDWAVFGNTPDNLEAFRAVLVKVQAYMDRRIAQDLPEDPIVVAVDECQVALKDPAIVGLLEDLIKRGRSAGVRVFLSTQEPTQGSMPTKIRNVIGVHIGFRQNEVSSSLIALGAGSLDDGMDCTKLPGGKPGRGVCFYTEGRVKVKAAKVDDDMATAVASRAGGPTHAALFTDAQPDRPRLHIVSDPEPEPETILDHLAAVWPTTGEGSDTPAPNAWLDHLLTRLPVTAGTYHGWGRPQLREAARAHGLEPREKVRVGERSFPGFTHADLMAAQAAWNAKGRGSNVRPEQAEHPSQRPNAART